MKTITKGTAEYKRASSTANELQNYANTERRNNNSYFGIAFEKLDKILGEIKELNVFASQIAESVEKSMNPYGYKVANISSKQAWILACAMVENNINFN